MIDSSTESSVGTWTAPECPYTIDYSPRVLDDIRLAVVDAFFSLPRGGAEIGGILLGRFVKGRISIQAYQALDCEHAMGPSFTLSQNDQAQLADLLAGAKQHPDRLQAVGWYHSHTRSEIFLSDADQDIHKRFFPEPWQIALVLKPSTFEPTRGGFFFREADGMIRGSASYQEFVVDAQPLRQIPAGHAPAAPPATPLHRPVETRGPVITIEPEPQAVAQPVAEPEPEPELEPAPEPEVVPEPVAETAPRAEEAVEPEQHQEPEAVHEPMDLPAPMFLQIKPERSWRWLKVVAVLALAACAGGAGYQTRQTWLPFVQQRVTPVMTRIRPALPNEAPPAVKLSASDDNGQLSIHWDGKSPAIQKAGQGVLEIFDGNAPVQTIHLNLAQLEAGAFTYSRQAERVEVRLAVGDQVKEGVASFLGKLPDRKPPPEDPAVRKERDDLRQQVAKQKAELDAQAFKTRRLEKSLNDMKEQLARESQRRMNNQLPDPVKK